MKRRGKLSYNCFQFQLYWCKDTKEHPYAYNNTQHTRNTEKQIKRYVLAGSSMSTLRQAQIPHLSQSKLWTWGLLCCLASSFKHRGQSLASKVPDCVDLQSTLAHEFYSTPARQRHCTTAKVYYFLVIFRVGQNRIWHFRIRYYTVYIPYIYSITVYKPYTPYIWKYGYPQN